MNNKSRAAKKFWRRRGGIVIKVTALVLFSAALLVGTSEIGRADSETVTARISSEKRYGSSSVDEIAGAEVAAEIAQASSLVIADSVNNLADSLAVQVQLTGTDTEPYLENPSLIATDTKTREDVTNYTVVSGDTVPSVARKFNITSDTIRWENDIVGDGLAAGTRLKILPVSGLRHKVTRSDTASSLADKYKTSTSKIISFNDAEVDGLPVGEYIIVPDGKKPATVSYYSYPTNYKLVYGGNGYTYGYCTWHAANRRAAVGNPIPRGLGNAVTWLARAQAGGLATGKTPKVGAVAWDTRSFYLAGGDGHVAFVEKINADGSVWLSHMNLRGGYAAMDVDSGIAGGWNRLSYTLVPAGSVGSAYTYIY